MKTHLAIDLGSESGRAVVGVLRDDGTLQTEEIYRFKTQFMQIHGSSVRDFYRYHEEIIQAMCVYREKFGEHLDSIGIDAWGGDFVLLNRDGNIAKLPASYRAHSATDDVSRIIEEKFGEYEVYLRNGNMKMPTDTLSQLVRLRQSGDPSMDDPRQLLYVADTFHYLLGAQACCEHSLASYGRFFNRARDDWDRDILRALDIPTAICGKIVAAGETIGMVDPVILKQAGLTAPVPIVTPCSHDTSCAALCVPDEGSDWAFISSGTWSLLGMETDAPVINRKAFEANLSNSTMPLKTNMFKKNITGTWIIQQCKQVWGRYSYDELVNLAEAAPDEDLFIDVNAADFYAPDNMVNAIVSAIATDFNVRIDACEVGRISRIVFESMAMKYRYYLEKLLDACSKRISRIYILGGGSKNRVLNRFTACATGYPVLAGVSEASSVGNLLLQAYGCGELADKRQMRRIIAKTFPHRTFAPQQCDLWNQKFQIFLSRAAKPNQW